MTYLLHETAVICTTSNQTTSVMGSDVKLEVMVGNSHLSHDFHLKDIFHVIMIMIKSTLPQMEGHLDILPETSLMIPNYDRLILSLIMNDTSLYNT